MTTPQNRMKEKLASLGLPFKDIHCYGRQIVVTSFSEDAANKWANVLVNFCSIKVAASIDEAKENKGTVLLPTMLKVWRTFGTIKA